MIAPEHPEPVFSGNAVPVDGGAKRWDVPGGLDRAGRIDETGGLLVEQDEHPTVGDRLLGPRAFPRHSARSSVESERLLVRHQHRTVAKGHRGPQYPVVSGLPQRVTGCRVERPRESVLPDQYDRVTDGYGRRDRAAVLRPRGLSRRALERGDMSGPVDEHDGTAGNSRRHADVGVEVMAPGHLAGLCVDTQHRTVEADHDRHPIARVDRTSQHELGGVERPQPLAGARVGDDLPITRRHDRDSADGSETDDFATGMRDPVTRERALLRSQRREVVAVLVCGDDESRCRSQRGVRECDIELLVAEERVVVARLGLTDLPVPWYCPAHRNGSCG